MFKRPAVVPIGKYGARFYCPPERRGTAKLVFTFRERCEPELASLSTHVSAGDSVIDVGAHYGAYTVALARIVGSRGTVIAIEPSPHAVEVLQRNIELNSLSNVTVIHAAASEFAGIGQLKLEADPSRTVVIAPTTDANTAALHPVDLVRVDDVADMRPIRFLKIDVEGAESSVLAGASSILREDRPVVQFEHNPNFDNSDESDAEDAMARMSSLGYRIFRTTSDGTRQEVRTPPRGLVNLLALP